MIPRNMAYLVCVLGVATAVISNNASKAVSEKLLKLHGRWKTDESKDMYVLETECNRFKCDEIFRYLANIAPILKCVLFCP